MIKWVNERLVKWGAWTAGYRKGANGPSFPAYKQVHIRSTASSELPVDSEVLEIDRIMAHVKVSRPEIYQAAYIRYVTDASNEVVASQMRCHINTVYSRLDFLHRFVSGKLTEKVSR